MTLDKETSSWWILEGGTKIFTKKSKLASTERVVTRNHRYERYKKNVNRSKIHNWWRRFREYSKGLRWSERNGKQLEILQRNCIIKQGTIENKKNDKELHKKNGDINEKILNT